MKRKASKGQTRLTRFHYNAHLLCLLAALSACTIGTGQTSVEETVTVWRIGEAQQEAWQDADLRRQHELRAQEDAAWQADQRLAQAVQDRQDAARHKASAALVPLMQACLVEQVRRLAPGTRHPREVAEAVLSICQPAIAAVASTVALVNVPSSGLAREMAIRLRPAIVRMVIAERMKAPQ